MNFPMTAQYVECSVCKRKALVERAINGSDHTLAVVVTCFDCIDEAMHQKVCELYPGLKDE